jgi:PAS domain S-box-containing protein
LNGMKDADPRDTHSPEQPTGHEQWQRVADSIADLLLLVDREGQILSANRPAFGHGLDGLVGRSVFEVCPEGLREDLRSWLDAVFSGESAPALLMPREQGGESVRWFATYTGRNDGTEPEAATVIVSDVTAAPPNGPQQSRRFPERDEALQEEYRRLKALEAKRDELVHMLVHDLRSPLTTLHVLLTIACEDAAASKNTQVVSTLEEAKRRASELSEMVGDVLDVSRFEGGIMPLQTNEHDIVEIAREAVADVSPRRGVQIVFRSSGTRRVLTCDRNVMRRVITNLVSNAAKASPPDGIVSVEVSGTSAGTNVSVTDRGDGIHPDMQDRIFDKYWRCDTDPQFRRFRGSGLGLAFCKLAVEAHGGEIGVSSQVGRGSRFYFRIPDRAR